MKNTESSTEMKMKRNRIFDELRKNPLGGWKRKVEEKWTAVKLLMAGRTS